MHPKQLKLVDKEHLHIEWSDGQVREYTVRGLRKQCPCATCREKRREIASQSEPLFPVVSLEEMIPLSISSMEPVGNYAYGIRFSDGHDTGIFSLEMLRGSGQRIEDEK